MKPAPFRYHAPTTVGEATGLLAEYGDEAKPLAGGQSLVPILALRLSRFEHLIDLRKVSDLHTLEHRDGELVVGAMVRQATVERDPDVAAAAPLLQRATPLIGHFQIRNQGTVGGSVAHADPAAEYPAVALALGATAEVASVRGTRSVPADDLFAGTWTTSLDADELLTALSFPRWEGTTGVAIREVARRAGDFALAGAAAAISLDDAGVVQRAGLALFGVGSTPVRAAAAEAALAGAKHADVDAVELGQLAITGLDPPDDVHASARYRTRVAAGLAAAVIEEALADATP